MYSLREYKKAIKNSTGIGKTIKIAIVGDVATQFLATSIQGEAILRGYNPNLYEADYNQVEMQVMDPNSELHNFNADYTVIYQSSHKLLEHHSLLDSVNQEKLADERIEFVKTICEQIKGRIIYYNYPEIDDTVFGSFSSKVCSSFNYQVCKLSYKLNELSQQYTNLFICNLSGIQAKLGRDVMFTPSVYINTEMVLSIDSLPYVASRTMDIISSAEGQFKKCLILDLDNTLWGGVVGDDGWEGIQIGHGLGIGKAFTEFQQWIKKLKNRGIILAVCSKNFEDKAKEPFEKNPEMVLRLEDIAVFIANWNNKADNIRTIQQILNIGFDSMVFLDDNPFERNMVRENIPDITVPELPEDPSDYLEYLYSLNLFETASYSEGDKDRTKQYQVEAQRVSFQKSFTNEEDYLKSLNMVSEVKGFDKFNTPRVAQLSQRSNQFNLRTVRYTESEIAEIEKDDNSATFSFTLSDKFGDNGLVCVIIMKKTDSETLFIDTWFMSCRVLKRGMENFTLNTIVDWAKRNGFKKIIGEYLPTPKNGMVANHYTNLGFKKIDGTKTEQFILDVTEYEPKVCFINGKD